MGVMKKVPCGTKIVGAVRCAWEFFPVLDFAGCFLVAVFFWLLWILT
jgi:hypothetical protein